MSDLNKILDQYRSASKTEREKGTYFEELCIAYFRYESYYKDFYSQVWTYSDWAQEQGIDGRDTGIDLVAQTKGTDEYHAIQCKFYAEDYTLQKSDIDSFFTASGQKPFTHRLIVSTTDKWSDNAERALVGQQPPVTKIDLNALEESNIDWSKYQPNSQVQVKKLYDLRIHQKAAFDNVIARFKDADRGKLIMACGTGKTFTSLRIAEAMAGKGKRVLFLVPSLSLLSQTLSEWTQQSKIPLHSFAVCSDTTIGKKRNKNEDTVETFVHELKYPATTEASKLFDEMDKRYDSEHMSVVFSTYHSIAVISQAQHKFGLADFDLIVCDEAHRTTGSTFADESDSKFVKVHDQDFIHANKRLYMTATPRIYADTVKAVAEKDNVALYSMDDESVYGKQFHVITFSEAVELDLLSDYKVIVLTIDEEHINAKLQKLLADENNQLKVDDAAKIIGCWKALSKQGAEDDLEDDSKPMQRAVAFCQVIEGNKSAKVHKVASKNIAGMFQQVVEAYQDQEDSDNNLICEANHVDGSMNASIKESKLNWLKAPIADNTCRILSNVRCLSEGVDVPALDAVLFLTPRNSQVDVVQSVGRVMRKSKGKTRGYVILPVVIPAGVKPSEALNDNKTYKVVWEVLQALRSHDDRFDAMINKLDLIGKENSKMEVIAITDTIQRSSSSSKSKSKGKNEYNIGQVEEPWEAQQTTMQFDVGEIERGLYAKVVKKCGNRNHWEDWAKDIAKIANTHISRITSIVQNPDNTKEVQAFTAFAEELRDDLNDCISNEEVIEMLAQHLITKPVFDALFEEYSFASNNPVSLAMQKVLDVLQQHKLEKEADTLDRFYASVKMRAQGIDNAEGKQKIVVELYDKFFRNAFPRMTERLGIVYTPVEVVDFIIHSIDDLLQLEFGQSLGNEGVHIIDPFTGTGTFITRLLQSGLISKEQLPNKYQNEIHANEIVLLAYYIAAINIEAVYHSLIGGKYQSYEGICLTDTFQMDEHDDLISDLLVDNSDRRIKQKNLDIRVIMGNPPYSVGQKSENDNNKNVDYPKLDASIKNSYAKNSKATLQNSLYDSYIRAIRWASDRIGTSGIIGFVTNAGFLETNTTDGLRKCLAEEFCSIYVFHLRGNQRTSGERSRQEGGKIFGSGSRAPIAITLLVKNPHPNQKANIFWYDIGDYLTQQQKLDKIASLKSIQGIRKANTWKKITPDKYGDWVKQRDDSFDKFIKIGDKKDKNIDTIFKNYSTGIATSRDTWNYNFSKEKLGNNMKSMIKFYIDQVKEFHSTNIGKPEHLKSKINEFINNDPTKISWTRALKNGLLNFKIIDYSNNCIRASAYRAFSKQFIYFDSYYSDMVSQMPKLFPTDKSINLVIVISGLGITKPFSCLINNVLIDRQLQANGQCFPLYLYEESNAAQSASELLLGSQPSEKQAQETTYTRKDGISDAGLQHFLQAYPDETISKEDIFYYVYGLLHSPDYRKHYKDNLSKELPRIPCVKKSKDFWAYSQAGRDLAKLHLDYETVPKYKATLDTGNTRLADLTAKDYYVTKMKFGKKRNDEGKNVNDKTVLIYNAHITIKNIPLEAYDYIVNGKPALEWIMDRQCVKTDKKSGITNDANDWAIETMHNPKYPLELFLRLITVSLKTMKIVDGLPELDID